MSLRSGLASLASSTSKIGRFMFGGDTIEETSEDDDSDDVSTDCEPNDGGTTDGGDSADGAPKGEVSDGSFAGSVSGHSELKFICEAFNFFEPGYLFWACLKSISIGRYPRCFFGGKHGKRVAINTNYLTVDIQICL